MKALTSIKNILSIPDRVAGVECYFMADGTEIYYVSILNKKKNSILPETYFTAYTPKEVISQLEENIPLSICFSGKGILTRTVDEKVAGSSTVIELLLPNAQPGDFLSQASTTESGEKVCWIIRKEQALRVVQALSERDIAKVSIGTMALQFIHELINKPSILHAGNHEIVFDNGVWKTYKNNPQASITTFEIDGNKVSSEYLPSFSQAISCILNTSSDDISSSEIDEYIFNFREKRVFQKAGWYVLIFFLGLLLVNFGVYSWQNSVNQDLQNTLGSNTKLLAEHDSLKNELKDKEHFLEEAGWGSSSKISYYSDQIAASVPQNVRLTEISIFPENEDSSRTARKYIFENNKIIISGLCNHPTSINPWMDKLSKTTWVNGITLEDYHFEEKENSGVFVIKIIIKP